MLQTHAIEQDLAPEIANYLSSLELSDGNGKTW